jgi:transposase
MGRKRRSFSREFKIEAVRLITEGGHSPSQVARDLGIRYTILGRWKKEFKQGHEWAFNGQGHVKPEAEELCQLRSENEHLRMERDIFKKAAAIFSKDSL